MNRRRDIDILRGFGIISVIYYHMAIIQELAVYGYIDMVSVYVSSFHMVLFFFLSGYCYKEQLFSERPWEYIKNKARSLLLPYVCFAFINTFLNVLQNFVKGESVGIADYVLNFFFFKMAFGAIWFLTALFICSIVSAILIKWLKNDWLLLLVSFVVLLCGLTGSRHNLPNVFRWQQALYSVFFYIVGYLAKKHIYIYIYGKSSENTGKRAGCLCA